MTRLVDMKFPMFRFVTAIYTELEGTRFNGNSRGIYDRYKASVKSLADGGYDIACFTSEKHLDDLVEFFKDNTNVYLIPHELEEYPTHAHIEAVKDRHAKYTTIDAWRSRCVEIMWGKFNWLDQFIRCLRDEEPDRCIFWIDAGLFHGGLISNTFRSETSKGFYDFDTITQHRNLYEDLKRYADGKIINIRSTIVNHGSDDYSDVYGSRPEYGIVGGIFGGPLGPLIEYVDDFTRQTYLVLQKDRLLKEEEIMYYLHSQNPEKFKTFEFNNWYHQDWPIELYNPAVHVSFSDFFKVIRE